MGCCANWEGHTARFKPSCDELVSCANQVGLLELARNPEGYPKALVKFYLGEMDDH